MSLSIAKIDFFEGEREYGPTKLDGVPENGETECTQTLRWSLRFAVDVPCGGSVRRTVRKERGISLEQRTDLEGTVRGELGVAFLSKLELAIRGSFGETLTLRHLESETIEVGIKGKDCYLRRLELYQLESVLDIRCSWKPRFRRSRYWEKRVVIAHPKIVQRTEVEPRHLDCGCRPLEEEVDRMEVTSHKLSLVAPYVVRNHTLAFFDLGIAVVDGTIRTGDADTNELPWPPTSNEARDWSVDPARMEELLARPLLSAEQVVPTTVLPAYLRFLIGADENDELVLRFNRGHLAGTGIA